MAAKLIALYPQPTDVEEFEKAYVGHLKLTRQTLGIPEGGQVPYEVTHFHETPLGQPTHYQMFSCSFPSPELMLQALGSPAGQALATDAVRLSTGGPPVFLLSLG